MVLAADGKTLRGAHQPDGSQTKLLCLYDHAHQLVLAQTRVLDGDEIAAFTTALAALPDLSGVVITADALHCQREHARWLHERGGHYLFTVRRTSRRCAGRWPRCRGPRRPGPGAGRPATAAPSPARSRSSTWTATRSRRCFRMRSGRSRSFVGVAVGAPASGRWRRCTRSPRWTTGTPTPGCWPSGSRAIGAWRTASITSGT